MYHQLLESGTFRIYTSLHLLPPKPMGQAHGFWWGKPRAVPWAKLCRPDWGWIFGLRVRLREFLDDGD